MGPKPPIIKKLIPALRTSRILCPTCEMRNHSMHASVGCFTSSGAAVAISDPAQAVTLSLHPELVEGLKGQTVGRRLMYPLREPSYGVKIVQVCRRRKWAAYG